MGLLTDEFSVKMPLGWSGEGWGWQGCMTGCWGNLMVNGVGRLRFSGSTGSLTKLWKLGRIGLDRDKGLWGTNCKGKGLNGVLEIDWGIFCGICWGIFSLMGI